MTKTKTTRHFLIPSLLLGKLIIIFLFVSVLIVSSTKVVWCLEPSKPDFTFTILHTNDLHAHDEPFQEWDKTVGGMARITHLIREIRHDSSNVLVIDAGDIFQGTPFFNFYHGRIEVELLNKAGYDIYTIGNHEFDNGPFNLTEQLSHAKFDIISSNIDASNVPGLAKLILPSTVKVISGHKIGFVGAITPDLEQISLASKVHIKDLGPNWIKPIKNEVERLTAQGINEIILVTHVGLERDKELAQSIPQVDVIIGGHSHTKLEKPVLVHHSDGTTTAIVQTGCYGRALGKLKLAFNSNGQLIVDDIDYHLININDQIPEEADIKAFIDDNGKPIQALKHQIVGISLGHFDNHFIHHPGDSPLGNMVCDAIWSTGTKYGATIALQNRGGIRSWLEKGLISMEEVDEILPFDNHLIVATVSGETLKKALEHSVFSNFGGRFLDVHGLKFAYDPTLPENSKLLFVQVEDAQGKWSDLNPQGQYTIAVNSYTFSGGEGYDFTSATHVQSLDKTIASVVSDYLIKEKQIAPRKGSRIVAVKSNLLSVVSKDTEKLLKLDSGIQNAKFTLIGGNNLGTSHMEDCSVPISNPKIVESNLKTDEQGTYYWNLSSKITDYKWLAVIIKSNAKTESIIVSAPVLIKK